MPVVKGQFSPYFETGFEGTYWTLYDEKYLDPKAKYRNHDGINHIKNGNHLSIFYHDYLVWEGYVKYIDTLNAKKDTYFKTYVKKQYAYDQLCFAGIWVHYLPTNIDLGLWHEIFFSEKHGYSGILTHEDQLV